MITFMESKEKLEEMESCLDSQLWHACAGGMIQMPSINSKVFYFPQGHAEHARGIVDFNNFPRIPAYILCRVAGVKFMADPETDEVFGKIKLTPISTNELDLEDHVDDNTHDKPASFAKTLTQSDANNGGGFSVPRYCAETIFPRLDYSSDPPVQTVLVKDVHGETWKFRHIYRGTPRRHLLTTGWSSFVNHKKLVAGDSIVFLRAENGELCVGIRRAKKGIGGGHVWNAYMEDESKLMRYGSSNGLNLTGKAKIRPEQVIEAATLAANGERFEVVYYPRASTPEFCVKASLVKAALRIRWCTGMRFKMAFETEDSSRISWFMGCISSVQVVDALRWPDSPWRLLQVTWDEPDLLQNVKCVSPWLVELVSNMPSVHLSPFSSPRKKPRLLQHPGQLPMSTFSGNPFRCLPNTSPAGMQGARHAHYGLSLSNLHFDKLQSGLFPDYFPSFDHRATTPNRISNDGLIVQKPNMSDDVSCVLTIAHSTENSTKTCDARKPQLVLFGQPILTEQQLSRGCSGGARNLDRTASFSDSSGSELHQQGLPLHASCEGFHKAEPDLETGHFINKVL